MQRHSLSRTRNKRCAISSADTLRYDSRYTFETDCNVTTLRKHLSRWEQSKSTEWSQRRDSAGSDPLTLCWTCDAWLWAIVLIAKSGERMDQQTEEILKDLCNSSCIYYFVSFFLSFSSILYFTHFFLSWAAIDQFVHLGYLWQKKDISFYSERQDRLCGPSRTI